jgi:hypothetical protein
LAPLIQPLNFGIDGGVVGTAAALGSATKRATAAAAQGARILMAARYIQLGRGTAAGAGDVQAGAGGAGTHLRSGDYEGFR